MMAVRSAVIFLVALSLLVVLSSSQDLSACEGETRFIKDGECDVDLNNAECMWDGGDCCECECEPGGDFLCGGFGFKCLDPESECHILESVCSNGIPGIESAPNDDGERACCPRVCGTCGGPVCFSAGLPEYDETGCCDNSVMNFHEDCDVTGAAPCVIDSASAENGTCSNGIPGLEGTNENGTACCPLGCTACGGLECATAGAAAGLGNKSCCINGVLENQPSCSTAGAAPCVIEVASSTTASATISPEAPTCSNGVPGIESRNKDGVACCDAECGFCGGQGCQTFPGGRNKCCIGVILDGDDCEVSGVAPCFLSKSETA